MAWVLPQFSDAACVDLLQLRYGLDCGVERLPGERDLNLLATTDSRKRFVLKIAHPDEDRGLLEAQHQALKVLADRVDFCPQLVPTLDGAPTFEAVSGAGTRHLVRLVSYCEGVPLGRIARHSPQLLQELGRCLGQLDVALADFDHPALHRKFDWDLARAPEVIDRHLGCLPEGAFKDLIRAILDAHRRDVLPLLSGLPKTVIYNDANDFNVIVGSGRDVFPRHQEMRGIVDFGDMVYSHTINDLAIAMAYAMLDKDDPLDVAASLAQGYHRERPLRDDEIDVVFPLACLRLAVSACIAAHQSVLRPEDPYLVISQEPIRRSLPRLAAIPTGFARATLRHACGLAPVVRAEAVIRWLRTQKPRPVLGVDLAQAACTPIDLSVTSPLISGNLEDNVESKLTARVEAFLKERSAQVGIGLHGEARMFYQSQLFLREFAGTREPRTVHMGMDVFFPAGSLVFSPLDGTVHAFGANPEPLDYGHVILLRHETKGGDAFFTLYGHLAQDSLNGLTHGRHIAAGTRIGTLGAPSENGGWTPHLHFQIILDLLELDLDFPGVCSAGQAPAWLAFSPDPNLILGIPKQVLPPTKPAKQDTQRDRRHYIGPSLSVAYRSPVKIERGWMQYLYDETGRRYLDAYNNVPHVGHGHPRVVAAAHRQMRLLNTNTRYLSDLLVQYAATLAATLPAPLEVCYFVNSASEANELALRLARNATGCRDLIVLESAYHGHTTTLIDISPYKHAGPGGQGPAPWVHVAPVPDTYRGRYRIDDPEAGAKYAEVIRDLADECAQRTGLSGFIAETCPSVGGQIFLPDGYLARAYESVRAVGGLCIADEVQTGYGRIGTHFYAFEAHGVVPDVVVLGKPIGNGHPIGAVITTREIADAFDNGMEFFSTFGGNTVSCAVGLEVLRVVQEEGLQEHARAVGRFLLDGFSRIKDRFDIIGDVRGSGLFLGIELVKNRITREPATKEATFVVDRMRDLGVLMGVDGPDRNVLKIRPPMPFTQHDASVLLEHLERVLSEEFDGAC